MFPTTVSKEDEVKENLSNKTYSFLESIDLIKRQLKLHN